MGREAEKKNTFKDVKKQQQQIFFPAKIPKITAVASTSKVSAHL